MDHVVCTGVMHFFPDPEPIFGEAARIVRKGGLFVFVVADRQQDEPGEIVIGEEIAGAHQNVVLYRFGMDRVRSWVALYRFEMVRDISFTVFADASRRFPMQMRAYVARKL